MDVGILGSYSRQSIGDQYILRGILNQLNQVPDLDPNVLVFCPDPIATKSLHANFKIETVQSRPKGENGTKNSNETSSNFEIRSRIKNTLDNHPNIWFLADPYLWINSNHWSNIRERINYLDLLIIGGGNLIMDLYPYAPFEHNAYTKIAEEVGTPVVYYAVGAGPIRSYRAKRYFSKSMGRAQAITTRDTESEKIINNNTNVHSEAITLSADPAVHLDPCENNNITNLGVVDSNRSRIGINMVPYYKQDWVLSDESKYNNYLQTFSNIIEDHISDNYDEVIMFGTNIPADLKPAKDIQTILGNSANIKIHDAHISPDQIFQFINQLDVVLCNRLHTLIPTFISNTPFVAFDYQPKVRSFSKRINLEQQVINLDLMSCSNYNVVDEAIVALERAEKWGDKVPGYKDSRDKLRADSNKSLNIAKEILLEADQIS